MSVRDFMSEKLITVTPETPIFDAVDLMKKNNIHRLPVVTDGKLVGLITEGVIAEAMPSTATSLSVFEVNYLLNKTTVKDIMVKKVVTIAEDALLEDAIYRMRQHQIGVLPVLAGDKLVGIITNNDIFDAFLEITGYKENGIRVTLEIGENHKGILADIAKRLADADYDILTVIVLPRPNKITLELQVATDDGAAVKKLLTDAGYKVIQAVPTRVRD